MAFEPSHKLVTTNLSDQVYTLLREQIINNEFKPGERLSLSSLEQELQISKTPLREAINRLHNEGFVIIKPRSGTFVKVPNKKDIIDMYDLRIAIEWKALQLSANYLPKEEILELQKEVNFANSKIASKEYQYFLESDSKFHGTIFSYCNNEMIKNTMEMIDSFMRWFRISSATSTERMLKAGRRHEEIISHLLKEDIKKACDVMVLHIEEVKEDMLTTIDQSNMDE